MADDKPAFRRATIEDAPAILEVIEAAFDRWPPFEIPVSPLEHLQWKMQPPVDLVPGHTVGELDGRVIAVEVRWIGQCLVDGEIRLANDGVDKAIHPDYQGRGLNRLLNESDARRQQSGQMGLAMPSRNERLRNTRNEGGQANRELRAWVRAFDLRGTLAVPYRDGGVRQLVRSLPRALARPPRSVAPPAGVRIEAIDRFDERADALWEAASAPFELVKVRRAPYLSWRYADRRSGRRLILGAFAEGGDRALLGFAVFGLDGDQARVLDLFRHPDHRAVSAALLTEGCARLRASDVRIVSAWLPADHPDRPALRDARFRELSRTVPVELDAPPGYVADAAWLARLSDPSLRAHVTMGDFDFG